MSHFAKLDENNIVVFVTVGRQEDDGREAELSARTGDVYKQTSYNTRGGVHYDPTTGQPSADQSKALRGNFAGIGFRYDETLDALKAIWTDLPGDVRAVPAVVKAKDARKAEIEADAEHDAAVKDY